MSELAKRTPTEYMVNGETKPGVKPTFMGMNADLTATRLTPYIDFDGIQVHPDHVNKSNTLRYNIESEKK